MAVAWSDAYLVAAARLSLLVPVFTGATNVFVEAIGVIGPAAIFSLRVSLC